MAEFLFSIMFIVIIVFTIKSKLNLKNNDIDNNYSYNIENNVKILSKIDIHNQVNVIHTLRKFYPRDFEEFVAMIFELK